MFVFSCYSLFFFFFFFFFNDTATTEIYTLSLHDALPISGPVPRGDEATPGAAAVPPGADRGAGAAGQRRGGVRRVHAPTQRTGDQLRGAGAWRVGHPRYHRADQPELPHLGGAVAGLRDLVSATGDHRARAALHPRPRRTPPAAGQPAARGQRRGGRQCPAPQRARQAPPTPRDTAHPCEAVAAWRRSASHLGWAGKDMLARRVRALPHHHAAAELDHHLAVLVEPPRAHLHDATLRPRPRLAHR